MSEAQWIRLIEDYANDKGLADTPHTSHRSFKLRMVKVAALAIAALENVGFHDEKSSTPSPGM